MTRTVKIALGVLLLILVIFAIIRHVNVFGTFGYAKEVSEEEVLQHMPHSDPPEPRIEVPILIYHNVRPDYAGESSAEKIFSITPETLDAQLTYLHDNGYTVISMDQLVEDIAHATTSAVRKPVVLTFDDGWQSQFTYVLPLLQKHHYTATFYIYTNAIGASPTSMTWSELEVLVARGMEIGDHSLSHPRFSGLSSSEMKAEILGGKEQIQQHLHVPVKYFATPYGYSNEEIEEVLKTNGFVAGRTTYKGVYQASTNQYALRAYLVKRSMSDFVDYLQGS